MENRLIKIEDFILKWKYFFWSIVILAGLVSLFFGFKIHSINNSFDRWANKFAILDKRLNEYDRNLAEFNKQIKNIYSIAEEAEAKSSRAYLKAGDISYAVAAANKASNNALDAALEVKGAVEQSGSYMEDANKFSKQALATAKIVEQKLGVLEKLLMEIKKDIKYSPKE